MASTYVNNLRLEEIGTGEQSGTWGDTTNTNLKIIGQAVAWGTRAIANASTDNITIGDGALDADRCLGLKLTGGGQACTVSLLPNTSSKTWFMYNATAAALTFTCGGGANVIIPAGQTKVIATDGLGSGGVVHDLLTAVNLAGITTVDDLAVTDDLVVGDDASVGGILGVTGVLTTTAATVFNGGFAANDGSTITTNDNSVQLTLKSTDADASGGPILDLTRDSANPADGDVLGLIRFKGDDAGGNETAYAQIIGFIQDEAGGAEDGTLKIETLIAGGSQARLDFTLSETVFNEGDIDLDFRVESNVNANSLYVQGDTGYVGFGLIPTHNFNLQSAGAVEARFQSTDNDCTLQISSDTDEAQNSILAFLSGTSARGSIVYDHHATAASQFMIFKAGDDAVSAIKIKGDGRTGFGIAPGLYGGENARLVLDGSPFTQSIFSNHDGTGADTHCSFGNGNGVVGTISTDGTATTYATSSDYRLKENVDYTWDATTRLKQLKPAKFNFISDNTNTLVDGFIAHEVSSIVPEAIVGAKDAVDSDNNPKYQGIDQSKLVPLLVKTIQELEARITALEG